MKKIILAGLLCCAFPASQADDETDAAFCDSVHNLSTSLMRIRQNGADMSMVMRSADGKESAVIIRRLVIAAYEVPRYQSETYRQQAIEDFANDQYLECVKTLQEI